MLRCRCLVALLCCAAATASYVRLNSDGLYDERAGVCLEKMFINGPDNADGKDGVCSEATNAKGRLLGDCKQTQAVLDCFNGAMPANADDNLDYQRCLRQHLRRFRFGGTRSQTHSAS